MSILSTIFSSGAKDIISEGGKIVDSLTTSNEEKLNAKNQLSEIVLSALDKLQSYQKEVILSETQGNKLQRNWRPIVMLAFAFIVVYSYFIQPAFFPNAVNMSETIPDRFWSLLEIGLGGYVIGRSLEKTAHTVTKNIDMSFLKKKDRKV